MKIFFKKGEYHPTCYVKKGVVKHVENLRWIIRKTSQVKTVVLCNNTSISGCLFVAVLLDGTKFYSNFNSKEIARSFMARRFKHIDPSYKIDITV